MTLNDLPLGVAARVTSVRTDSDAILRFMEMGLVRGTTVRVKKVAPLGDPLEVELRGYDLSIRGREAQSFTVEPIG